MFNIETIEDVKILKELTNDNKIKELETEVQRLSQINEELLQTTKQQKETINKLQNITITADQCRNIVFDLLSTSSKTKNIKEKAKRIQPQQNTDKEEFTFTHKVMKKKFHKIIVEGNNLIHQTIKNQRMPLPVSTIELLALSEVYQHRERKLLNKDQKNICKLFNINKVQFGKLYYNLKEGVFFKTIDEIDNQTRQTVFRMKNGTIHIVDGNNIINTRIDSKKFNQLLNIYANSNQPYSTIYKLSMENKNIDPIHLLLVLRKNEAVSKTIIESR